MFGMPLTRQFIMAVFWLGRGQMPVGSGVGILHNGREYLVTARHVAEPCNYNPTIRARNQWLDFKSWPWKVVANDEHLDITVLQTDADLHISKAVQYGQDDTIYGTLGRALGFPTLHAHLSLTEQLQAYGEAGGGRPLPVNVLVTVNLGSGDKYSVQYAGGYLNSGFSGGAILWPVHSQYTESKKPGWTLAGIITERGHIYRRMGSDNQGQPVYLVEPSGMVRFTKIEAVFAMIDNAEESCGG